MSEKKLYFHSFKKKFSSFPILSVKIKEKGVKTLVRLYYLIFIHNMLCLWLDDSRFLWVVWFLRPVDPGDTEVPASCAALTVLWSLVPCCHYSETIKMARSLYSYGIGPKTLLIPGIYFRHIIRLMYFFFDIICNNIMEIYSLSCKKFNSFVSTMNLLYSAVRLKSKQRTKFMDCIYLAVLSLLHHGIIFSHVCET